MSTHEYTASQALDLLLRKLRERDNDLARHVQAVIDGGKDEEILERKRSGGRRKPRAYRKTTRLTETEALGVALDVLQAYFVEQPLFVGSAEENFRKAGLNLGASRRRGGSRESPPVSDEEAGTQKSLEIELQVETQLRKAGDETFRIQPVAKDSIHEQRLNIERLRKLFDFGG